MAKKKKKLSQKWRFAIGTTSRSVSSLDKRPFRDRHYLIFDIDGKLTSKNWKRILDFAPSAVIEPTRNGFHIFTNRSVTAKDFVKIASYCGADDVWIEIGKLRGYWFLADSYRPVILNWAVERMILYAA
jgi:hypothetical protein